jgi:HEPN domain-containing protein
MTREQLPDDFATNLVDSIFELYVIPDVLRRGLVLERDDIRKVVVELNPDRQHPLVWINDAAQIVARVRVNRDLAEGEDVRVQDIDEVHAVEPVHVGPNSGYVCFAILMGQQYIRFDFRYNKERVASLLTRAREFLDAAVDSLNRRPAVACDLAFSAAELSVQAQMLIQQQKTKSHWQRQEWLDSWAQHSSAPQEHADALRDLREHRLLSRYSDAPPVADRSALERLFAVVEEMIQAALSYAAEPLQRLNESRRTEDLLNEQK